MSQNQTSSIAAENAIPNASGSGSFGAVRSLTVGQPSPYPPFANGAVPNIGLEGLVLVISLPDPLKSELRAVKNGRIDIGMIMMGSTGFLLWRFAEEGNRRPISMETSFR